MSLSKCLVASDGFARHLIQPPQSFSALVLSYQMVQKGVGPYDIFQFMRLADALTLSLSVQDGYGVRSRLGDDSYRKIGIV